MKSRLGSSLNRLTVVIVFLAVPMFGQTPSAVVRTSFGEFTGAVSLSLNNNGVVSVVDGPANMVYQFDTNGTMLRKIGGQGWGDLEFDQPVDVCATFPLDVYVSDRNNRRIQRYNRYLNYVQTYDENSFGQSFQGKFIPRASALSSRGELFIVETDGNRIVKLNTRQQIEREFGAITAGHALLHNPTDIALSDDGTVAVLDGNRVVLFDQFGNYRSSLAVDHERLPLAVSSRSDLLLVTGEQTVSLYSTSGETRFVLRVENISGIPDKSGQFRDAALLDSTLYLLTEHTLLVVDLK